MRNRGALHLTATAVKVAVQLFLLFPARDKEVSGHHAPRVERDAGSEFFFTGLCEFQKFLIRRKRARFHSRNHALLIAERRDIKVMLQAIRREHNVTELHFRRNAARNSRVQNTVHMKALRQNTRGNRRIDLADAGADQRNFLARNSSGQKAHTRTDFLLFLLELFGEPLHFFFHGSDHTDCHIASFVALR